MPMQERVPAPDSPDSLSNHRYIPAPQIPIPKASRSLSLYPDSCSWQHLGCPSAPTSSALSCSPALAISGRKCPKAGDSPRSSAALAHGLPPRQSQLRKEGKSKGSSSSRFPGLHPEPALCPTCRLGDSHPWPPSPQEGPAINPGCVQETKQPRKQFSSYTGRWREANRAERQSPARARFTKQKDKSTPEEQPTPTTG